MAPSHKTVFNTGYDYVPFKAVAMCNTCLSVISDCLQAKSFKVSRHLRAFNLAKVISKSFFLPKIYSRCKLCKFEACSTIS